MNNSIKDLLLINSLNISDLVEQYRMFFLGIIPGIFILAVIIEYFDRLAPLELMKRVFVAIIILTSITSFYEVSIDASMRAADEILNLQKSKNVLLSNFFDDMLTWNPKEPTLKEFFKDETSLKGALSFLKYHLFSSYINDFFTLSVYLITSICFIILKVVYSLVYYMGHALVGIPCLLYIFPTMGNVLRGGILSYVWCLVMPHVVAIIVSIIGSEINKGYVSGEVIGGSLSGTALLIVFSLFLALSPMITAMILNGSGISQAGGIIATLGANKVLSIPSKALNVAATMTSGGVLGPKMKVASNVMKFGSRAFSKSNTMSSATKLAGSETREKFSFSSGKSEKSTNNFASKNAGAREQRSNQLTNSPKNSNQSNTKLNQQTKGHQSITNGSKSNSINKNPISNSVKNNSENKNFKNTNNSAKESIRENKNEKLSNDRRAYSRTQKENVNRSDPRHHRTITNTSSRVIRPSEKRK